MKNRECNCHNHIVIVATDSEKKDQGGREFLCLKSHKYLWKEETHFPDSGETKDYKKAAGGE